MTQRREQVIDLLRAEVSRLEEELMQTKKILKELQLQDQQAIQDMHAKSGKFGLNCNEL